jgi:hypothetical protein
VALDPKARVWGGASSRVQCYLHAVCGCRAVLDATQQGVYAFFQLAAIAGCRSRGPGGTDMAKGKNKGTKDKKVKKPKKDKKDKTAA